MDVHAAISLYDQLLLTLLSRKNGFYLALCWCAIKKLFHSLTHLYCYPYTFYARLSHRNSVCPFVRPSVCHTGGSVKNGAS